MDLKEQVKILYDQGLGSRSISKQLNITRYKVQEIYKELEIYNLNRPKCRKPIPTEKICKTCKINKKISQFRGRETGRGGMCYEPYCKECESAKSKIACKKRYHNDKSWYQEYKKKNFDKIKSYNKEYREKNKNILRQKYLERYKNEVVIKPPKIFVKKDRREYNNNYVKNKRKNNICFKLRQICSHSVRQGLKRNAGSKLGESFLKYFPYTIEKLKQYLESLFEPWMTWDNHGNYHPKIWDDDNQSTWTWQLDHIIPCSDLPYSSMEEENFQKCWALSNLRPLSAKQNIIDGTNRIRHKKKDL